MSIDLAIRHCGSAVALAEKLGVERQAVSQWAKKERPVPLARALEIERLTDGAVTCESLRPDIDWTRPTQVPARAESPIATEVRAA